MFLCLQWCLQCYLILSAASSIAKYFIFSKFGQSYVSWGASFQNERLHKEANIKEPQSDNERIPRNSNENVSEKN